MTKPDPSAWWSTAITDMAPGRIALRGHPIEELIGNLSFAQMIWLMLRGDQPSAAQAELLECALVAGVDHGPQAPSIATARMAVTCGLGLNNALASAVNMLGDVHGGAGEQCAGLYLLVEQKINEGLALDQAASAALNNWRERHGKMVSGFGHRFHKPEDPRAPRLLQLVRAASAAGTVSGRFADIAIALQRQLELEGKRLALNIDGATAVIFCELGFAPPLARGLFCLSRSVGILAHAWEQQQQGGRNKGPMPPEYLPNYKPKTDKSAITNKQQ